MGLFMASSSVDNGHATWIQSISQPYKLMLRSESATRFLTMSVLGHGAILSIITIKKFDWTPFAATHNLDNWSRGARTPQRSYVLNHSSELES